MTKRKIVWDILRHSGGRTRPSVVLLWIVLSLVTGVAGIPDTAWSEMTAVGATPTSVTLAWTAPRDGGSTVVSQYDIRYSTSAISQSNWSFATQVTNEPSPLQPGTQQTITITGLRSNTTYYFAAKVADASANWSPLSSCLLRKTPSEAVPPATVANLSSVYATSTSVRLSWMAPGDDGTSGTATTYDIRYSTAAITLSNWSTASQVKGERPPRASGVTETFTVTGLNSGVTYYFAIRTADEVLNWSGLSNNATKATLGGCCIGTTGDVNIDGRVDLSDLTSLQAYLTGTGYVLRCYDEADVNVSGRVDLSDLTYMAAYLTGSLTILPNCR